MGAIRYHGYSHTRGKCKQRAPQRDQGNDDISDGLDGFVVSDDEGENDNDDDDDNDDGPRQTTKRARTDKPACQYGAACYRQDNPHHTAMFSHPNQAKKRDSPPAMAQPAADKQPITVPVVAVGTAGGLADLFTDCNVLVPVAAADRAHVVRYLVAYGGDVAEFPEVSLIV